MTTEEKIKQIENDDTYKKIVSDSHGGVMYMVDKNEYDITLLSSKVNMLEEYEKEYFNGVMKGALRYVDLI